jgi:hypothetical protein
MKITDALLGEHGSIYPLLDFIEANEGESSGQAAFLRSTLLSHANLEDTILKPVVLPHLPKSNGGPTDHEAIAAQLEAVSTAPESQARALLLEAVQNIRKHFRKEETLIFPIAERELSPADQQRLADDWARLRGVEIRSSNA